MQGSSHVESITRTPARHNNAAHSVTTPTTSGKGYTRHAANRSHSPLESAGTLSRNPLVSRGSRGEWFGVVNKKDITMSPPRQDQEAVVTQPSVSPPRLRATVAFNPTQPTPSDPPRALGFVKDIDYFLSEAYLSSDTSLRNQYDFGCGWHVSVILKHLQKKNSGAVTHQGLCAAVQQSPLLVMSPDMQFVRYCR